MDELMESCTDCERGIDCYPHLAQRMGAYKALDKLSAKKKAQEQLAKEMDRSIKKNMEEK